MKECPLLWAVLMDFSDGGWTDGRMAGQDSAAGYSDFAPLHVLPHAPSSMLHAPCPMHDAGPFHPTRPQPHRPSQAAPKRCTIQSSGLVSISFRFSSRCALGAFWRIFVSSLCILARRWESVSFPFQFRSIRFVFALVGLLVCLFSPRFVCIFWIQYRQRRLQKYR